jgi:hypothetical protein
MFLSWLVPKAVEYCTAPKQLSSTLQVTLERFVIPEGIQSLPIPAPPRPDSYSNQHYQSQPDCQMTPKPTFYTFPASKHVFIPTAGPKTTPKPGRNPTIRPSMHKPVMRPTMLPTTRPTMTAKGKGALAKTTRMPTRMPTTMPRRS